MNILGNIECGERIDKMLVINHVKVCLSPQDIFFNFSMTFPPRFIRIPDERLLGIDLNSNWGYKWKKSETASPCSDAYPGQEAFEAYETKAMAKYLDDGLPWSTPVDSANKGKEKVRKVRAFVDLHSYGQLCRLYIPCQTKPLPLLSFPLSPSLLLAPSYFHIAPPPPSFLL